MQKGESNAEAFIILGILILVTIFTYGSSSKTATSTPGGLFGNLTGSSTGSPLIPTYTPTPSPTPANVPQYGSSYSKSISLNAGNASYVYQPYEEYISIFYNGTEPVNISGWKLKNGKDQRAYDYNGSLRYFEADFATIPQGTLFISPTNTNAFQNIVLNQGETAVITTGSAQPQSPYKIVSFKENICSGYLEAMPEYAFTPSLTYNCPRPANEPGVSGLGAECRQFVERMSPCRTPEFNTRNFDGSICTNCADNVVLSSSCLAFIKNHFNYGSCIYNHRNDPNFSLNTWRVFLGKGWEMWGKNYETISLFDQLDRLITSYSY